MAEVDAGAVAPVETPVAAPVEATPPESTADTTKVEQPEAKPERTFTQKELDEIVQKRLSKESRRAERLAEERVRRELAERELERLRAEREAPKREGEPREEDFAGKPYSQFVEAKVQWAIKQALEAREAESAAEREQREAVEQAQAMSARLAKDARGIEDFEDVALAEDLPISPAMARAIAESDMPAKVAMYLGQNREEAERIFDLPVTKQIREIGRIEDKLKAPPKPTQAPPPIVPNGTKTTVEKRLEDANIDEFFAIRKRQLAAKRGR